MTDKTVTENFASWVESVNLASVPEEVKTRMKYLLLDGIACGLLGSRLPWSVKAKESIVALEPKGECTLFGWDSELSMLSAALLNSTFIQAFEIDEFHFASPIHASPVIIPAIFAAAQHESQTAPVSGKSFLEGAIVGYETGPRVGLSLGGVQMLGLGWHSGPVFGPAAAAAAVAKMLNLPADVIEDAIGTACTQAGGLMAAQYEGMVKRMQHGFAARNGLLAAYLSKQGYTGIKKVFDREYGGFSVFSHGSKTDPKYDVQAITKELGETWEIFGYSTKKYASCAVTHGSIECIRVLQQEHPERMKDWSRISNITIEQAEVAWKRGAFVPKQPITPTAAQMSTPYAVAVQLVDGDVTPVQFASGLLNRDELWQIMPKVECKAVEEFAKCWAHRATVTFDDGHTVTVTTKAPRGVDPPLTTDEILQKWRTVTKGVITPERQAAIEKVVLNLEEVDDVVGSLRELLREDTVNVIA